MKKYLRVLLLAAAVVMALPTEAQGVKFGVKGGYNITDMKYDKNTSAQGYINMGKENKNGWYIGPTLKFSLIAGLGADIAAFYDQRESELALEGAEASTIKQQYVYVPINLRYNIGLGGLGGIYIAAGPQFGFNVGDTDVDLSTVSSTAQDKFQLKKSTFGVNVGAGIYLFKHLEVGAVYCIPLGNTADIESVSNATKQYDVKNNTFQVSAAIYF